MKSKLIKAVGLLEADSLSVKYGSRRLEDQVRRIKSSLSAERQTADKDQESLLLSVAQKNAIWVCGHWSGN